MYYIIENDDGRVLSEGPDKDKTIEEARKIEPSGFLVGTGIREDGSEFGFFASPVPGLAI